MRALALAIVLLAPTAILAQTDDGVRTDPETGERYRAARPEEPIRQGPLRVPPWVVYGCGTLVALGAAGVLVKRLRAR